MKRKHHDPKAWQFAMQLVQQVYVSTASFPREEQFNLTSQMRRAAVSVPSNIAEGAARMTKKEFGHFLCMARGSLSELETQYLIAKNLAYVSQNAEVEKGMDDVFGLLGGLINSLRIE